MGRGSLRWWPVGIVALASLAAIPFLTGPWETDTATEPGTSTGTRVLPGADSARPGIAPLDPGDRDDVEILFDSSSVVDEVVDASSEEHSPPGAARPATLAGLLDVLRGHLPKSFGEMTEIELASLEDLDLSGAPLTDDELQLLVTLLPDLRRLNLRGAQITDVGLQHLIALDLEFLELRDVGISGQALGALGGSRLENLQLCGSRVNGSDLHLLPSLPALKTLKLNRLELGDDAVGVLAAFPTLRHLEIDSTRITAVGLRNILQDNSKLERIELRQTTVDPEELARLQLEFPDCELVHVPPGYSSVLFGR